MSKVSGSFRTTISVPRELKRRMKAVKEDINWSALACRAFEDKLAEIAAKRGKNAMADVIQRLRASKQRGADALYRQGHEDGRRWASEQAEYDNLVRLEQLYEEKRTGRDWEKFFDPRLGPDELTIGECLMMAVCPVLSVKANGETSIGNLVERDCWRHVCATFWKSIVGDDDFKVDSPSYVRGFAEGALALWSEVKDRL